MKPTKESQSRELWIIAYLIIIAFFMILFLDSAAAYSNTVNVSITEFRNLTRADNAYEVTKEINNWLGGLFGIGILAGLGFVSFSLTQLFRMEPVASLLMTFFFLTIVAGIMRAAEWISDFWLYLIFGCLLIFVGVKVATRK